MVVGGLELFAGSLGEGMSRRASVHGDEMVSGYVRGLEEMVWVIGIHPRNKLFKTK